MITNAKLVIYNGPLFRYLYPINVKYIWCFIFYSAILSLVLYILCIAGIREGKDRRGGKSFGIISGKNGKILGKKQQFITVGKPNLTLIKTDSCSVQNKADEKLGTDLIQKKEMSQIKQTINQ